MSTAPTRADAAHVAAPRAEVCTGVEITSAPDRVPLGRGANPHDLAWSGEGVAARAWFAWTPVVAPEAATPSATGALRAAVHGQRYARPRAYASESARHTFAMEFNPTDRNTELALVQGDLATGRFDPPAVIDPDPADDSRPALAIGPQGRVALAWLRGGLALASQVRIAVIEGGRVLRVLGIDAPGVSDAPALVATDEGFVAVYTHAHGDAGDGVYAVALSAAGEELGRATVSRSLASAPQAAWDGYNVALVYDGVGSLWYAQLSARALVRRAPVAIVRSGRNLVPGSPVPIMDLNSSAGLSPTALVARGDHYWLGYTRLAPPEQRDTRSQAHVLLLHHDGHVAADVALEPAAGISQWGPRLARTDEGVHGAFVETDAAFVSTARRFEARCRGGAAR